MMTMMVSLLMKTMSIYWVIAVTQEVQDVIMVILHMIKHRHREVKLSLKRNSTDRLVLLGRVARNNFSTKFLTVIEYFLKYRTKYLNSPKVRAKVNQITEGVLTRETLSSEQCTTNNLHVLFLVAPKSPVNVFSTSRHTIHWKY